jgi:hypothetical protein
MRLPDSTHTINATENISVFSPHFHKVYNNHHPADPSILRHVPQCRTMWELNDPITWDKFSQTNHKLKNAMAPGLIGVPSETFKAMHPANQCHIYHYVNSYSVGTADYEQ